MEKSLRGKRILAVLAVLMPILQASVLFLIHKIQYGTGVPGIMWTDEATYSAIIKTWTADGLHGFFGNALGYYGYNGGHAIWGHGSAWNPAALLPYIPIAKIFGYSISVVGYTNIALMALAILLFIVLTNPGMKNLISLIVLEAVSYPVLLYMTSGMTELSRYAYAVILAGLIFRLFEKEEDYFAVRYIITPIAILFMMQAYIFFVFAIPVYMWGILRKKKVWVRLLGAFFGTLLSGGCSYLLLHFISSNYDTYKTDALLNALSADSVILAIKQIWWVMEDEIVGSLGLLFFGSYGHGMIRVYLIGTVLITVYLLLFGIIFALQKKRCFTYFVSAFCICLFHAAFWTLYSIEPFTLLRSTAIVLLFSMYLLIAGKERFEFVPLILFATGMICLPENMNDFNAGRFDGQQIQYIQTLEKDLCEAISVDSSKSPWEVTVSMYTMEPRVIAAVPAGMGINFMLDDRVAEDSGYLLFSKASSTDVHPEWLEQSFENMPEENLERIEKDFTCIWENSSYALYKRN